MLKRFVDTYLKSHENLKVYNSLAGGLGTPYHKRMTTRMPILDDASGTASQTQFNPVRHSRKTPA